MRGGRGNRGDARERGLLPADRRARVARRSGARHARAHVLVRHVRLFWPVRLPGASPLVFLYSRPLIRRVWS